MSLYSRPKKLYKYLSPKGATKLFENPSIWFRLSSKLNDVFDMRPAGTHPIDGFGAIPIFCLCETPTSMPMWTHYCEKGQGVVLEFNTDTEFFKQYKPYRVQYQAKRPTITELRAAALVKSKEWAYEREWRCFAALPRRDSEGVGFLASEQAVSVPFPFHALSAVIHGYDGVTAMEATKFLENPLAGHVKHLVCRIDPWTFALNLRTLDDITHIHENRDAMMKIRR